MKLKSLLIALVISSTMFAGQRISELSKSAFSSSEKIEQVYDWTEYTTFGEIKIDYKYEECNSSSVKNQILVLFRFTNLTSQKKNLSWTLEVYRNDECVNCSRIENPEYSHELTLEANEVVQGSCNSKENKALYVFGNFVKLSPGMSDQKLTGFKFINLQSSVVQ